MTAHLHLKERKAQRHIHEHTDQGKAGERAKHAVHEDGWERVKEPLMLNRQATIKDDGGQQVPASGRTAASSQTAAGS